MDIYAENILEHYRNPHNKERLKAPTVSHEEINHSCGDELTVDLVIKDGVIKSIGWDGTGCAISQAAISILSEEFAGKTVKEVEGLTKEDILKMLGVPIGPRRIKCALLCLHTIKNALKKERGEDLQNWLKTVGLE